MSRPTPPCTKQDVESALDVYDRLTARLAQAKAMVSVTFGESGEGFRTLSDVTQSNYMWAVSDILRDIGECVTKLSPQFLGARGHE